MIYLFFENEEITEAQEPITLSDVHMTHTSSVPV
jgi:hypothetical protein